MTGVPLDVAALLRSGRRVLLLAHLYPDGDVLGSQLGLGLALRAAGTETAFACAHPVPEPYRFLPGAHQVERWSDLRGVFDLVVTLDCPNPERLGGLLDGVRPPGTRVLNVDHHGDNRRYGDVNWVDPAAAATGEMVYELLRAAGFALTPEVAVNLYTAIVTDTGSFRYANTTPRTLRIAAALVEAGADPARVAIELYETRRLPGLRLLGQVLQQVETTEDGTIAWLVVDRDQMRSADLLEGEDLVTFPRSLRTVKAAVLFRELEDAVKVSLRAKGEVDVAAVAARLGGGGHPNAAGVLLQGDLAHARTLVLEAVREALGTS